MNSQDRHLISLCKWLQGWRDRPSIPFALNTFTTITSEKFWSVADREAQDVLDFHNGDRTVKSPRHISGGIESTMTDLWLLAGSPAIEGYEQRLRQLENPN